MKLYTLIVLIAGSYIGTLMGAIKHIDYEIDSIMAPCVLALCSKYFKSERALKGSLAIINLVPKPSVVQARILRRFNEDKSHNLAVMVKDSRKHHRSSRVQEKAQNYFMLLQHFDDFDKILKQVMGLPTWNPLGQIVIQFTIPFENETIQRDWTERLFVELLSNDALKVNVLFQFKNDTKMIKVVTWFPYHKESCAESVENIREIEICVVTETTNATTNEIERSHNVTSLNQKLYPIIPNKLHNCTLRVSSVPWEPFVVDDDDEDDVIIEKGLEVIMLRTIAQGMKLTPSIKTINKERATRTITDNNRTGLYSKLLQKKADVMIGGMSENQISRKLVSSSVTYYQDDITWCVAKAGLAPKWMNVFIIFNKSTWIGLAVTILITSFVLYFFVKHEGRYRENYAWAFLIMFSLSTNQYAHYAPVKGAIKIFFAGFFFFGLHISTAYHSYLINVLTNPRYSEQIDTVAEAIYFNMTFQAAENTREFFLKNDSISKFILKNYQICKRLDECFKEVVIDKKKAVAISRSHALNNPLQLKEGVDFACFPVEDNVVIYSVVMLFRKFHHLLPFFNDRIRIITESGLLSKWELDSIKVSKKQETSGGGGGGHGSGKQTKLSLEHVEGAFFLVIIGLGIALLTFILECCVHHLVQKKKHLKVLKKIEGVLCYA